MSRTGAAAATRLWSVPAVHAAHDLLPGPMPVSRCGPAECRVPGPEPWPCHEQRLGRRPRGGLWAVDAAAAADLRGCGGGFFPAARKWRSALSRPGRVTVVANAAESEPLSAKDAVLLSLRPHLVLDGLALLAEALDGSSAVLWLHDTDTAVRRAVVAAVEERRDAGLDELTVRIRAVHGGYLSGESTAIKQAVEGGPLAPQFRGFGPDSRGDYVLVHNAETLARLALLCREAADDGARAPAGALHPHATRLLTVVTPTDRRVVEVPSGTRLAEAVGMAAGAQPPADGAVLLAGYGGAWARWSDVAGLSVAESAFRQRGHSLGAGIVAPLWEPTCGLGVTAAIAGYLARASARQCGPCLFGLPALAEAMARLTDGRARRGESAKLREDLAAVAGRGACHHPDGAVRLVRSALEVFPADLATHAAGTPCGQPYDTIPVPEE